MNEKAPDIARFGLRHDLSQTIDKSEPPVVPDIARFGLANPNRHLPDVHSGDSRGKVSALLITPTGQSRHSPGGAIMREAVLQFAEQPDPHCWAKEMLPTMYDLPSEDPEEPGVPDQFHYLQPDLLTHTFRPPGYASNRIMTAGDMNLYYDVRHPNNYKRPDWYAALGVPFLYEEQDMRLSYVIWQEEIVPSVVVELLSPSTEKEDLGLTQRKPDEPPTKWEVYEEILGIPYYVVFSRYTDRLRIFKLIGGRYYDTILPGRRLWMPEMELGLGLWQGEYREVNRLWLRWYDADGNWIPTPVEQESQRADQESQRADQESQRADQEKQRAVQEKQRAVQEKQRAEQEKQRAEQEEQQKKIVQQQLQEEREQRERLLAQMKALGIVPDVYS